MTALVGAISQLLADAGCGAYNPTGKLPANAVPITVAGSPAGNGSGKGAAITVTTYPGGPEPDSRNGWEYPRLQVKVRHTDPLAALDLERATYEALQFRSITHQPRELPGGWWLQDCHALQSEAAPLGQDANGRWEFVRNYQLTAWPS